MYKTILSILCVFLIGSIVFGREDASSIKQNLKAYYLIGVDNDSAVESLISTVNNDGFWPDLDYTSERKSNWFGYVYLNRLKQLCIAHENCSGKYYNNDDLKHTIIKVLNYWLSNNFVSENWWFNEIGSPQQLGIILLLSEDFIPEKTKHMALLKMDISTISKTGQNRMWLTGIVFIRELLRGNIYVCRAAAQEIYKVVQISDGKEEGIQFDYSFHQHGHQLQLGNYGLHFIEDVAMWMYGFEGTSFAFSDDKIEIIRNYIIEAQSWVLYKHRYDFLASGRHMYPNYVDGEAFWLGEVSRPQRLTRSMKVFAELDKKHKAEILSNIDGQSLKGFNFFQNSNYAVYRDTNFMVTQRMCSERIIGAEAGNGENQKGYHLGDASMCIYRGSNEYNEILPVWNWRKLPGTTVAQDTAGIPALSWGGYNINSDFVGGLSFSGSGITTMKYTRDGTNANKSYFYTDNSIICLGSGISSSSDFPVETSINQCLLNGDVKIHSMGKTIIWDRKQVKLDGTNWILHDSIAYVFPEKQKIELFDAEHQGKWNYIITWMPDTVVRKNLFSLSVKHGVKPNSGSYEYMILPNSSEKSLSNFIKTNNITVLSNTTEIQAIKCKSTRMTGVVFLKASTLHTSKTSFITADNPCIVLIKDSGKELVLSISDPTQKLQKTTISLSGKINSKDLNVKYDSEKHESTMDIPLPQGKDAGTTASVILSF